MFRAALYSRVSTNDQHTLSMQSRNMREYAARRGWSIAMQVREVGSGAAQREAREKLLNAARRREIDIVVVWRLDRWGRSVTDLLATLQELEHLGVGFVSLTEALDLTTPSGRAMAGLLAVFAEFEREILRERVRAGLADAKRNGQRLGRPMTAGLHADNASDMSHGDWRRAMMVVVRWGPNVNIGGHGGDQTSLEVYSEIMGVTRPHGPIQEDNYTHVDEY